MAAAILRRISNKQRSTDTVCKTISALQLLVDKFLRLLIVLVYRILSKFVFQLSNSFQERMANKNLNTAKEAKKKIFTLSLKT